MLKELAKQQAEAVAKGKDDLIREAINYVVGNDKWLPKEIKNRGDLHKYPDGIEVFVFDNKPLIEFHPMEVSQTQEGLKTLMNASFNYKLLYT